MKIIGDVLQALFYSDICILKGTESRFQLVIKIYNVKNEKKLKLFYQKKLSKFIKNLPYTNSQIITNINKIKIYNNLFSYYI